MADKKKKTGIGLAAWLLVAIVLLIVFLVKWETIHNNLVRAGVIQGDLIVKEEKPETKTEKSESKTEKKSDKKSETITLKVQDEKSPEKSSGNPAAKSDEKPNEKSSDKTATDNLKSESNSATETKTEETKSASENKTEKSNTKTEEKTAPKPVAKTELKICFIVIDADGTLNYKIVSRSVNKTDSPLTSAINLVLAGPSMSLATEKNCTSLIPAGTKLLGASVSNGVATLNFNDKFEFNPDGMEGYIAQLKQIIFTATQFDTVKSVQFLIEGKKVDYLGSEGVWIGTPLSRASF